MIVTYTKFMKHAQKMVCVARLKSRSILQGVHHDGKGNLICTDSHRLYRLANAYTGESKTENPKTGATIDGNYPDTSRLLPDPSNAMFSATFNVDEVAAVTKLIEQAGKVNKASSDLVIQNDGGWLKLRTDIESFVATVYNTHNEPNTFSNFEMYVQAKYIMEAFAFLKDVGFEKVQFHYFGIMRPILFIAGDLTILLLPIRKYGKAAEK